MPEAPEGFEWHMCAYEFDQTNTAAFVNIALSPGQEGPHIPLRLDHDVPFYLMAIRITFANVDVQLWDVWDNPLLDDFDQPAEYASASPPSTVLEGPWIACPPGSSFVVRLRGR